MNLENQTRDTPAERLIPWFAAAACKVFASKNSLLVSII